jgi:hypothetical protein
VLERARNRWIRGLIGACGLLGSACSPAGAGDDNEDAEAETDGEAEVDSNDTEDTEGEFAALIDHERWEQIHASSEDPLADHRPSSINCGVAGWYRENEIIEIDTNFCNYLALRQDSLAPITEGAKVRLGFYHFDLVAPEEALAHLAVLVDGQLLHEQEIAIPGKAMVYALEFEAPFSAPAGAELVFHLHNHGQNTWALQDLSAEQ